MPQNSIRQLITFILGAAFGWLVCTFMPSEAVALKWALPLPPGLNSSTWPTEMPGDTNGSFWLNQNEATSLALKAALGDSSSAKRLADFYDYCTWDQEKADWLLTVAALAGDETCAVNLWAKYTTNASENDPRLKFQKQLMNLTDGEKWRRTHENSDPFAIQK